MDGCGRTNFQVASLKIICSTHNITITIKMQSFLFLWSLNIIKIFNADVTDSAILYSRFWRKRIFTSLSYVSSYLQVYFTLVTTGWLSVRLKCIFNCVISVLKILVMMNLGMDLARIVDSALEINHILPIISYVIIAISMKCMKMLYLPIMTSDSQFPRILIS